VEQLDSTVERSLTTKRHQDTVGSLLLEDLCHKLRCDGQEINSVCQTCRCLHGGDVGVDQNSLDLFFFESLDALRTGIIEFSGLADGETSRPQDQHFTYYGDFISDNLVNSTKFH